MIRNLFLIVCFVVACAQVNGQSGRSSSGSGDLLSQLQNGETADQISIQLDSLLMANYYKFMTQNSKIRGVPGYRIRIYSESGLGAKEEQQRVRARFISLFPGIDAYHRYDEPFFKVYVGDCRTRSEAVKLHDQVKKYFPNSFILPDYINIDSTE